ncbi:MAG TPA: hypothetical protein VN081_06395, partial [Dongiaceae bacterium]|nr:hypothetical protein [Dongiaceae bacterium]
VNIFPEFLWKLFGPLEEIAKVLAPKVLATFITLVWNFVWYNKVIFKGESAEKDIIRSLD